MDAARPLRDVFADLVDDESARQAHAADPDGFLEAQGHPALPGNLVSQAIVNYADTAPAEVAEHLAPFVMAHSPVPVGDDTLAEMDSADGLDLLTTAPAEAAVDDLLIDQHAAVELTGHELTGHELTGHELTGHELTGHDGIDADADADADAGDFADPSGLDFGHGESGDLVHTGQVDAGQVDAGQFDGGQFDGGQFDGGELHGGELGGPHDSGGPASDLHPGAVPDGGDDGTDWFGCADLVEGAEGVHDSGAAARPAHPTEPDGAGDGLDDDAATDL